MDQGRETLLFSQNFRFTFHVLQNFPFRICTGRMQEWREKRKGAMNERTDAGDEGCRAGGLQEMRDAGQEGCKR